MTVSADAPRYMQPVVHQKALTEAFVAQLNAEHDHQALASVLTGRYATGKLALNLEQR